jgi:hypothetical protein
MHSKKQSDTKHTSAPTKKVSSLKIAQLMTAKTKKVKSIYSTAVSHLEKKTFADSGQSYIAKKNRR